MDSNLVQPHHVENGVQEGEMSRRKRGNRRVDSKDLILDDAATLEADSQPRSTDMNTNGSTGAPQSHLNPPTVDPRTRHRHLRAIHAKSVPSCLSYQDTTTSPDFWGFRNILILMLIVSNLRLMIENFRKYGILICVSCHSYQQRDLIYGSILYFSVPCHLFIAFLIEKFAAKYAKQAIGRWKKDKSLQHAQGIEADRDTFRRAWYAIATAQAVNATLNLSVTSYVVYYHIFHPGVGTICELHAIIVWLKVCSYAFTNRDLRDVFLSPQSTEDLPEIYKSCPYPNNITISNLCYFWWAPTLVYQPVYPRTDRIRWSFVAKRFGELGGILVVIWIMSAQYAVPLLVNSLDDMSTLNPLGLAERLLKLSTISLAIWLAGFFAIFQSYLNGLAEITMFADRSFYLDWWNAPNLRVYWTTWNRPVYSFMKRHIYTPLVARNVPSWLAQVLVFTFSGVLHELLVGIPTHNVIGVAFAGMLWQIPLIIMTDLVVKIPGLKGYGGKVAGNMIFWLFFTILGQPLAALLYFYAWQAKYGSVAKARAGVK